MNIPNVHPADELAAIREEIKQLEGREKDLRAQLLAATDEERNGDQYRAYVQVSTRSSIDKEAIIAALGIEVVEPFIKATSVSTLKTARKEHAEQT
jgi:hypothetical protein